MLIKQPYELKSDKLYLKVLIYGQPGIGKSTFALSMPDPVLLDADGGVRRIAPQHRVPTLQVTSYQEVLDLLASKELAPFKTIVIDTAGKLLDYINAYIIKQDGKNGKRDGSLSISGWGVRASTFERLTSTIATMGKHLVFVAHEKEEKDGETKVVRPDFGGGKAGNDLIKDLDLVGYMEAIGKSRTVSFSPCEKYYAKNSARIDDVVQVPLLADGAPNNLILSGIVEQCEAAMTRESEQVKEYNALMDMLKTHADAIEDAESATSATEFMGKQEHLWDSKQKAWAMIREKTDALGLVYDKAEKRFAPKPTAEE